MKKKLLSIYPWIIVILVIQTLTVKITFSDPALDPYHQLVAEEKSGPAAGIYFSEGLIKRTLMLKDIRRSLTEDTFLPQDAKLEKTEDKLNRIILFLNISAVYIVFLLTLTLSSWYSLNKNTWYAVFLNKSMYALSLLFIFQNLAEKSITVRHPLIGVVLIGVYMILVILTFYNFFTVKKTVGEANLMFTALQRKLKTKDDEEHSSVEKKDVSISSKSLARTLSHFGIIIFTGIAAGNLLYIPVFTIQKNFSAEFAFILLILLILLSSFYIKKYNEAGYEHELSKKENILSGIAFLQYRFLKNTFNISLMILGVVLFFTLLISLLTLNTSLLRDALGVIEKTTEL